MQAQELEVTLADQITSLSLSFTLPDHLSESTISYQSYNVSKKDTPFQVTIVRLASQRIRNAHWTMTVNASTVCDLDLIDP